MKQDEFIKVAVIIRTSYPASNFLPTKEAVNTWYELLKDLDFNLCFKSVKMYIQNSAFPPTIADIRKGCSEETKAFAKPWNEAWDSVSIAVRKYGTYGAIDAMNSLDDITRKCVKQIGWYDICTSPNIGYHKRDFKESYEEYKKQYDNKVQANDGAIGIEDKGGR